MNGSVLVIGAGPAGMRASAELLRQGFKVFLVEERPTIGGKMAQLDKLAPTNECSTCVILPQMLELTSNPNLALLSYAEVTGLSGAAGDFTVKVLKQPRYVDPLKCNACTDCMPACPVGGVPMAFNFGRGASKAISFYSPFPPRKAMIHPDKCTYLRDGKCGDGDKPPCVVACQPGAIAFDQKPQEVELRVGAVLVATGVDELRDTGLEAFGYPKTPNVLTSLQVQRLLSGLGPTGGVVKRDDGKLPGAVAWIVPDGTTPVGFLGAAAEAMGTIERDAAVKATVLYAGVAAREPREQEFLDRARECGVAFVAARVSKVAGLPDGSLAVEWASTDGAKDTLTADMLVVTAPQAGLPAGRQLFERLGVVVQAGGGIAGASEASHPLHTSRDGVFVCGGALQTGYIDEAIAQACAAAANAGALLAPARGQDVAQPAPAELFRVEAEAEPAIAVVICRCGPNIAGLLDMDDLVRYAAALPHVKTVEVTPFACDGVKLRELLGTKRYNRLVLGACSPRTHEALFALHARAGGLNQHLVEIVNLRNHCTWVHSQDKAAATRKAKTLLRMGVRRAALLEALDDIQVAVTPAALVVGATPAGVACTLKLAEMGLEVHLVETGRELAALPGNDTPLGARQLEALGKHEEVVLHLGARLAGIEGFLGNYLAQIAEPGQTTEVSVGAIVIATAADLRQDPTQRDFERDLMLQRTDTGSFVGALGILNPLDFNTDGVFRCGAGRGTSGLRESVMEGEGAASRAACILTHDTLVKSPIVSYVVDENCDGCAYCIEPCPAHALTLLEYMTADGNIKKTVQANEAICRGCGVCMATCPKMGIYVRHYKPEQFVEMFTAVQEG